MTGVGKSSVSAQLALALYAASPTARVGILDVDLIARHVVSEEGKKSTELDGVDFVAAAGREGPGYRAMYLCLELKNELGMNGASGLQSAYTYRKAISMEKVVMDITLAGPYICFHGAILAHVIIV